MDFIKKLPLSNGSDIILVIIDRLTKQSIFIPIVDTITSPMLAKLFVLHFKSSYWESQDHAEVNLNGIAARYVVTVVSKKDMWESCGDSHAVTIQWVHMVVDSLLTI